MNISASLPLYCVAEGEELTGLPERFAAWARANHFAGQRGRLLALPAGDGALEGYAFGTGAAEDRPALITGLASA